MQDKIGEKYVGIVSGVTSFGIFVELSNTIEGLIRFEDLGNDYYVYDDNRKTLTGERTKEVFSLGKRVKVEVIEASKDIGRIRFKKVENRKKKK